MDAAFRQKIDSIGLAPILIGLLLLSFGLKQTWTLLYNIWLHPLATVPGPLCARISSLYMFLASVRLEKAQTLAKLHKKYGVVVRIAPNEVSISDWTKYRDIYGSGRGHKSEAFYAAATFLGHENLFSMRVKAQHHARRKMQSQPYSQQSVQANEGLIAEKADILARRILDSARRSESGKTADVYTFCGLFSLEVILKAAFDQDCKESANSLSQMMLKAMDTSALLLPINAAMPFLKPLGIGRYMPGFIGDAFRQFELWVEMTTTLLKDFRQHDNALDKTQRFLATPLLTNQDDFLGRMLSEGEAVEEALGIMFAGSGTTSTTLTYLTYALASAQDIQTQLREELQAAGESLADVKDLAILNAVIKETMRLYPTIISTLPRVLDTPMSVDGYILPQGTEVGMQNYVHHRDPKLFPQPDEFLPRRWLSNDSDMNAALTPFSLGPRNCIGQNLARAELYLATSKIFRTMKVKLADTMDLEDMAMEDRFNIAPKGRRLVIDVEPVA